MNEILFNALFDREIHNLDFLRGRIASCIHPISEEIAKHSNGDYLNSFYIATILYNDKLVKYFGLDFLKSTLSELNNFKDFLYKLSNSSDMKNEITKRDFTCLIPSYYALAKHVGYVKRSRIIRRFNNFKKITSNFVNKKLSLNDYKEEIQNQLVFFEEMLNKISDANLQDICIYYFVYDIRASENVRKLKHQIEKISN